MTIVVPQAAIIPLPPAPVNNVGSVTVWDNVAKSLRLGRRQPVVEVLFPRTLPVQTLDDLTPYHFIESDGAMALRKGAPPRAVKGAAADFAAGNLDLNGFLDRIGVPKA